MSDAAENDIPENYPEPLSAAYRCAFCERRTHQAPVTMTTDLGRTFVFPSHCARRACLDFVHEHWETFVVHDAKAVSRLPS